GFGNDGTLGWMVVGNSCFRNKFKFWTTSDVDRSWLEWNTDIHSSVDCEKILNILSVLQKRFGEPIASDPPVEHIPLPSSEDLCFDLEKYGGPCKEDGVHLFVNRFTFLAEDRQTPITLLIR